MANNTTKKAGSNKSFIDRMGGQKFIVLLVVIALFIFFCAMSPNFRKYTTFINIQVQYRLTGQHHLSSVERLLQLPSGQYNRRSPEC